MMTRLTDPAGLYNAFLAPGSPCELNIDHSLRNALAGRMTRAVSQEADMFTNLDEVAILFDQARTSVFKLMASVSVVKFSDGDTQDANAARTRFPSSQKTPSTRRSSVTETSSTCYIKTEDGRRNEATTSHSVDCIGYRAAPCRCGRLLTLLDMVIAIARSGASVKPTVTVV